jgi:hypothetical protein
MSYTLQSPDELTSILRAFEQHCRCTTAYVWTNNNTKLKLFITYTFGNVANVITIDEPTNNLVRALDLEYQTRKAEDHAKFLNALHAARKPFHTTPDKEQ